MLGFARAGLGRLARGQQMRALSAASAAPEGAPEVPVKNEKGKEKEEHAGVRQRRHNFPVRGGRGRPGSSVPAEQMLLMNKHKQQLDATQVKSLHEAVELLDWKGNVAYNVQERIATMMHKGEGGVETLSDRQLGVLFGVFGEQAASVSRVRRTTQLNQVLESMAARGQELGERARTAVIRAKCDNGEKVDVVEELRAWESAGLRPDGETYAALARAYAMEGNVKGVSDIISFVREEGLPVGESLLEAMMYAVGRAGAGADQAAVAVKRFVQQPGVSEVRLRCAAAKGAIAAGDANAALALIENMPAQARIHARENNLYVLDVLVDWIESGLPGAVEKLRPHLTMTEDGSSVVEFHNNPLLKSASRRARQENRLEHAFHLYGLTHPTHRSDTHREHLCHSIVQRHLHVRECAPAQLADMCELAKRCGLMEDVPHFMLDRAIDTTHAGSVYHYLKQLGAHTAVLDAKSGDSEWLQTLARNIAREANLSKKGAEKAAMYANMVEVLFGEHQQKEGRTDWSDIHQRCNMAFYLIGKDVDTAVSILPHLSTPLTARCFNSAVIGQLMFSRDPLSKDKLAKFLDSEHVNSVHLMWVQMSLQHLLKEEGWERNLPLLVKIITNDFPSDLKKKDTSFHAGLVRGVFGNKELSEERLEQLVDALEKEPRVGLEASVVSAARVELTKLGLGHRADQVERLKKKSEVFSRMLRSSARELATELDRQKEPTSSFAGVLCGMIGRKILQEKVSDVPFMLDYVNRGAELVATKFEPEQEKKSSFWKKQIRQTTPFVVNRAMEAAIDSGDADAMAAVWAKRKLKEHAPHVDLCIAYIGKLVLSGRGDEARAVCAAMRDASRTVSAGMVEKAGSRLSSMSEVDAEAVAAVLKQELNVPDNIARRLTTASLLRRIDEMISNNRLKDALQLACEETRKQRVAIGHNMLFRAAIKKGENGLLEDTFHMVANAHNKNAAFLELAFAMLIEGQTVPAGKLLQSKGLTIKGAKLEYFVSQAVTMKRPDILLELFRGLRDDGRASAVDLNRLLVKLGWMYYNSGDKEALASLAEEVERVQFPLEARTSAMFEEARPKMDAAQKKA